MGEGICFDRLIQDMGSPILQRELRKTLQETYSVGRYVERTLPLYLSNVSALYEDIAGRTLAFFFWRADVHPALSLPMFSVFCHVNKAIWSCCNIFSSLPHPSCSFAQIRQVALGLRGLHSQSLNED